MGTSVDLRALVDELGDDAVLTDPDRMAGYRWDRARDPDAGLPLAVVRASSTADVQAAVRFAAAHHLPIVTRGAGTGLSGGSSAINGCLVISTERMRRIEVDPALFRELHCGNRGYRFRDRGYAVDRGRFRRNRVLDIGQSETAVADLTCPVPSCPP